MVNDNNFEVTSAASSDISERERAQILGKPYFRRKPKTITNQNTVASYTTAPSKQTGSSFEIISINRPPADQQDTTSFEIISVGDHQNLEGPNDMINHKIADSPSSERPGSKNGSKRSITSMHAGSAKEIERRSLESVNRGRDYVRIQTQTVGIQTSPADIDCGCMWGDCMCKGGKCNEPRRRFSNDRQATRASIPEEISDTTLANYTESSSQTLGLEETHYTCNCRSKWVNYDTQSTTEDHFSDNSEDSYSTDFLDLPYQNNEEYLKLLRELEHKLVARNRERVRKTMLEFERRSRQNQNLEKPIWDYGDDGASLLRKLKFSKRPSICCRCGRNKRMNSINSDIMQNEKRWDDEMNFVQPVHTKDMKPIPTPNSSRVERSLHRSHWQLDPRSGEWIKVSCFQQTDFARHPPPPHGDYFKEGRKKIPPPPPLDTFKKECRCRQKKRPQ